MLELIRKAQEDTWQFWDKKSGGFKVSLTEPTVAPAPTAECILALCGANQIVKDDLLRRNKKKMLDYLLTTRWTDASDHYENIMAYSFSIMALKELGCDSKNKRIKRGLQFLRKNQKKDGGWPFTKDGPSHPFFTFLALSALLDYYNPRYKENIKDCHNYFKRLIVEEKDTYERLPSSYARCLFGIRKIIDIPKFSKVNDKLKSEIEEGINAIKSSQRDDGTWNPEPSPVSVARFRMNIFTIETTRFLLEMDDCPFDKTYGRVLGWINNNKRKIGWSSDVEKSEAGLSWTTATVLLTLCDFYKRSNNLNNILRFFTGESKPSSFIAYAREDENMAFLLKEFIEEVGLRATGMFDINTQVSPLDNVLKQIRSSRCLFAIYTKNTEKRPNAWKNVLGEFLAAKITERMPLLLAEEGAQLPSDASYSCTYIPFKSTISETFSAILKELKNKKVILL